MPVVGGSPQPRNGVTSSALASPIEGGATAAQSEALSLSAPPNR